jgi:hypothetical protein
MKPPRTLASLLASHTRSTSPKTKAKARERARTLCATTGTDVPSWAALAKGTAPKLAPATVAPVEAPAVPLEVTPALRKWAAAGPGRVVNVKRDGSCRLITLGFGGAHQEAAFTDPRTAERALLLGISWRASAPPTVLPKRGYRRNHTPTTAKAS